MKVGELFVTIGFKDADKATKQLAGIKKGLSSISSEALSAFAQVSALVGAFTGLAVISGNAGQKLTQYANLTGVGIDKLQDWQYALGNAGVSIEETTSALTTLQRAFSNPNLMKSGPPPWLGYLSSLAKVNSAELLGAIQNPDPSAMMEIFRRAAQSAKGPKDKQTLGAILSEQGLSNNIIQALFAPSSAKAPQATDSFRRTLKQAEALAKVRVEVTRLGQELERKFDSFVLKNFGDIRKVLEDLIRALPQILTSIGPIIHAAAQLAKTFLDWSLEHPDMIKNITELAAALYALSIPMGIISALLTGIAALASPLGAVAVAATALGASGSWLINKIPDSFFDNIVKSQMETYNSAPGSGALGRALPSDAGIETERRLRADHGSSGGGTTNLTQNIQAPDPIEAARLATKGVFEVVKKSDLKKTFRSNPRLNDHS